MAQETELLVHPGFFLDLRRNLRGLGEVRIEPKRGRHPNELTQFRYDVTLCFGPSAGSVVVDTWSDWREQPWSAAEIRGHLLRERPHVFAIRHVANARLETATLAITGLREADLTAGELRDRLSREPTTGLDPEDLWAIGGELPYAVQIDWSTGDSEGRFDAVFVRSAADACEPPWVRWPATEPVAGREPVFGNPPLQKRVAGRLIHELREHLKRRLPEYMLPAAIVRLDQFPLTVHGKLDRFRLPPPDRWALAADALADRPPTPTEQAVARIWAEVLRLRHVGLHDNFFDLGGHSLMAMQVVTRMREAFEVELSVRSLFEAPTVAELALLLTERKAGDIDLDVLLRQLDEVERLSDEEVWSRIDQGGSAGHE